MIDKKNIINDPKLDKEARLAALSSLEAENTSKKTPEPSPGLTGAAYAEVNNHIHTFYSFSPYSPSMAALLARDAGLGAAGSVDHDSISAAHEMHEACAILGIGGCVGFEIRVSFKAGPDGNEGHFASRKLNNPDSAGIAYMTVQGVPQQAIPKVIEFLAPLRAERLKRSKAMAVLANHLLHEAGLAEIDFDRDIIACSQYAGGGGITDRHLLAAIADKLIDKYGKGSVLTERLKSALDIAVSPKLSSLLSDPLNPHYLYDLLGVLKTGLLPRIYIQPDNNECIPAEKVCAFATSIAAIPAYAYLGDIGESITGDKIAEKFEDEYIDELFTEVKRLGYQAVTYMPPRNTISQLRTIQRLARDWGFMEISGVDINSSRQSFNCPEVLRPEFCHLIDTTWALIAHERLASVDEKYGLFSENNPCASMELHERVRFYSGLGRELDLYHPEESALKISGELDKGIKN